MSGFCRHCDRRGVRCGAAACAAADPARPYTLDACRPCWVRLSRRPPGQAAAPVGPCRHLGAPTGETVVCPTCRGHTELKLFSCAVHGDCTSRTPAPGHACCPCPEHAPEPFALVAPLGTAGRPCPWEGRARKRPWHFKATAIIPHLDTLDLLAVCLDLTRMQTEPPYVVVVDTGSPPAVCAELETWRAADLEIHYVRGNGWTNSSEPVCAALDLGMARVNTEFVFLTHSDVFLARRDSLAWLLGQCSATCPVVGYEMSERSWVTTLWQGMVSHTFTALHAETVVRAGVTWHMQRARWLLGMGRDYNARGWPDTETGFNLALKEAGLPVKILGPEPNYQRHSTENFDHARSLPGLRAYGRNSDLHRKAEAYGAPALAEARARATDWRASAPAQTLPQMRK